MDKSPLHASVPLSIANTDCALFPGAGGASGSPHVNLVHQSMPVRGLQREPVRYIFSIDGEGEKERFSSF